MILAHQNAVRGIAWNNSFLLSGGMDGKLRAWNLQSPSSSSVFDFGEQRTIVTHLVSRGRTMAVISKRSERQVLEVWDMGD